MAIAIVDYCKGNLRSVQRGIETAGYEAFVTASPDAIAAADAIVLPGVGAFADASHTMCATGQMEAITARVRDGGVPFLGICLGMQLMLTRGNEGCAEGEWAPGLDFVAGEAIRLPHVTSAGKQVKIPHVGWNSLEFAGCEANPLFEGVDEGSYFYFTHSYYARPDDARVVTAYTTHAQAFPSAIRKGNIFGMQFHPEKSSALGLHVVENFCKIVYGC